MYLSGEASLVRLIINIIGFIGFLLILYWIICCIKSLISIIKAKKQKEKPDKDIYKGFLPPFITFYRNSYQKWRKAVSLLIALSMLFCLISTIFPQWPYNTQIGSAFEKGNYTALYEAQLYLDEYDLKNYDVIVELERVSYDDEDGTYCYYYIKKAYFNKNQFIAFEEHYQEFEELLNKKCEITSDDDVEYFIKVSDKQVNQIPD